MRKEQKESTRKKCERVCRENFAEMKGKIFLLCGKLSFYFICAEKAISISFRSFYELFHILFLCCARSQRRKTCMHVKCFFILKPNQAFSVRKFIYLIKNSKLKKKCLKKIPEAS